MHPVAWITPQAPSHRRLLPCVCPVFYAFRIVAPSMGGSGALSCIAYCAPPSHMPPQVAAAASSLVLMVWTSPSGSAFSPVQPSFAPSLCAHRTSIPPDRPLCFLSQLCQSLFLLFVVASNRLRRTQRLCVVSAFLPGYLLPLRLSTGPNLFAFRALRGRPC